jgi:hypothetical protein
VCHVTISEVGPEQIAVLARIRGGPVAVPNCPNTSVGRLLSTSPSEHCAPRHPSYLGDPVIAKALLDEPFDLVELFFSPPHMRTYVRAHCGRKRDRAATIGTTPGE